jgi:PAS domain S-box-containing protein
MTADRPRLLPQAVLDAIRGAVAHLLGSTNVTVGRNYIDACERAATAGDPVAAQAAALVREVIDGRQPGPLEYSLLTDEGRLWFELVASRFDGDGYDGLLVTHTNITRRKTAAEALRHSETQYRAIVESAPVGIYQTAPDGRILAANQSLADIVAAGTPGALIGININAFYAHSGEREALIAQHVPERTAPIELEWKRIDGVPIAVEMAARAITDAAGRTIYWEGFVYDISERKRLEAQLVQSQKMESVGRLAGGIAHDFNNLLTVMIGYAELLDTADDIPASYKSAVSEILAAARRAAELTGRMLAFARKQRVQPRAVKVNEVVRGLENMLRRIIGEDVRLDVHVAPEVPAVLIDPAQLEQVIMNLAVNARDAMPMGGTLTITTEAVQVSDEEARRRPGLRPGAQVKLAMADTGVGMDAETLARVFEPFFTTKEPGKGTGLGLAMCYGIVKQANGFIACESTKGVGTTCTVLLPALSGQAAVVQPPVHSDNGTRARAAAATILVVEDEPVVRQFVTEILRGSGHRVEATGSPEEGLRIAATTGQPLDLVVTDVVMPQMDGLTLAARIRETRPETRVLLMSGYQDRGVTAGDNAMLLLPKPFTAAQLRARVAEALHASAKGRP